jgi:alpha-D-ribose 1-methylphosphonate 5-triphosphate synthase subunit PhnG
MNEQLTTKQNKTIEALLLTNTIDRAAKRANVSEASIYRWMKQESFQTALRAARRDILAHTTTRLQQMSVRALDTLENVMDDQKASSASRVSASRLAMEMMYRGAAIDDIIERLKTVEGKQLSHRNG